MKFWGHLIIVILIVIVLTPFIALVIKYANTPTGEVPFWVTWLLS